MTVPERAKALVQAFLSMKPFIQSGMESHARLAMRAAVDDEREGIIRLCMEFASTIDRNHGGDAIRELATKIRERER